MKVVACLFLFVVAATAAHHRTSDEAGSLQEGGNGWYNNYLSVSNICDTNQNIVYSPDAQGVNITVDDCAKACDNTTDCAGFVYCPNENGCNGVTYNYQHCQLKSVDCFVDAGREDCQADEACEYISAEFYNPGAVGVPADVRSAEHTGDSATDYRSAEHTGDSATDYRSAEHTGDSATDYRSAEHTGDSATDYRSAEHTGDSATDYRSAEHIGDSAPDSRPAEFQEGATLVDPRPAEFQPVVASAPAPAPYDPRPDDILAADYDPRDGDVHSNPNYDPRVIYNGTDLL